MEAYDIDTELVIQWALNYADYQELETVAKTVYGIYIEQRKKLHPELQKKAKQYNQYAKKVIHKGK